MERQFQELVAKSVVTHGSEIKVQMSSQMIVRDQLSVQTWKRSQLTADEEALYLGLVNLLLHRSHELERSENGKDELEPVRIVLQFCALRCVLQNVLLQRVSP